jgi:hypothetical protein
MRKPRDTVCQPPNQQLQRTVIRHRVRAAGAARPFAPAARMTRRRAAAELHVRRHGKRSVSIFM